MTDSRAERARETCLGQEEGRPSRWHIKCIAGLYLPQTCVEVHTRLQASLVVLGYCSCKLSAGNRQSGLHLQPFSRQAPELGAAARAGRAPPPEGHCQQSPGLCFLSRYSNGLESGFTTQKDLDLNETLQLLACDLG